MLLLAGSAGIVHAGGTIQTANIAAHGVIACLALRIDNRQTLLAIALSFVSFTPCEHTVRFQAIAKLPRVPHAATVGLVVRRFPAGEYGIGPVGRAGFRRAPA